MLRVYLPGGVSKVAAADLQNTQHNVLQNILRNNRYSKFGREKGFDRIECPEDYLAAVETSSYEDLSPYIGIAKKGDEQGVLTQERVHMCRANEWQLCSNEVYSLHTLSLGPVSGSSRSLDL